MMLLLFHKQNLPIEKKWHFWMWDWFQALESSTVLSVCETRRDRQDEHTPAASVRVDCTFCQDAKISHQSPVPWCCSVHGFCNLAPVISAPFWLICSKSPSEISDGETCCDKPPVSKRFLPGHPVTVAFYRKHSCRRVKQSGPRESWRKMTLLN